MSATSPTCGSAVNIVGTDEGTQHYEPVSKLGAWFHDQGCWVASEQVVAGTWAIAEAERLCHKLDKLVAQWSIGKVGGKQHTHTGTLTGLGLAVGELQQLLEETPK